MKLSRLFVSLLVFLSLVFTLAPNLVFAEVKVPPQQGPVKPPSTQKCKPDTSTRGVLIDHPFKTGVVNEGINGTVTYESGFDCYLNALLTQNMPYVILIALVLIIWSGIEYMLGGLSGGAPGKAKERIIAVLSGVAFYFLITYILNLLTSGYNLPSS